MASRGSRHTPFFLLYVYRAFHSIVMSGKLAAEDRELLQQLLEDVEALHEQCRFGAPRPATTRTIFVPILRRWIVEGLFFRAQKLILPTEIKFAAHATGKPVQLCKAGVYEHWMGMVIFGTLGVGTGRVAPKFRGTDGKPTVALDNSSNAPPVLQRPSDFFKQRMFYWKGQFYTRKDTIEMHANALGGVHFDMRRTKNEAHIIELKNYLGFEVRERNIQMLIGQEISDARSDPSRRTNVYDATELLTLDTGRIFSEGVLSAKQSFTEALMSNHN